MPNRRAAEFMRHVQASVRTSEDLIVRNHVADDIIVDIEALRIAALILAMGTSEDNDTDSGKDGRRMSALLSDTYEVSPRDEFIASRINICSSSGRLTLLDLAVLFGQSETARGLAELGVDMTLWECASNEVTMSDLQCSAMVGALASGRFWTRMEAMFRKSDFSPIAEELKRRVAMVAIRMGEEDVARNLFLRMRRQWLSWAELRYEAHMSPSWLFKRCTALDVALSIGLDSDPHCTMTYGRWTYYGMSLWEVALLTGHAEAAWILIKHRIESGWSEARGRLDHADWQWLQSTWSYPLSRGDAPGVTSREVSVYVRDRQGSHQCWLMPISLISFSKDVAYVIRKSRMRLQHRYGTNLEVYLLLKAKEREIVQQIFGYLYEGPAILLQLGSVQL